MYETDVNKYVDRYGHSYEAETTTFNQNFIGNTF